MSNKNANLQLFSALDTRARHILDAHPDATPSEFAGLQTAEYQTNTVYLSIARRAGQVILFSARKQSFDPAQRLDEKTKGHIPPTPISITISPEAIETKLPSYQVAEETEKILAVFEAQNDTEAIDKIA